MDPLFDGWWIVESTGKRDDRYCYRTFVRQIKAGEPRDIELHRGPFPTREQAEEHQYRDLLEDYWEAGFPVWADHCLECGSYAKVLAFDNEALWAWRVTECKDCGIQDSRTRPRWADLFGLDPNYTDGQDINEWLDEQRGEA